MPKLFVPLDVDWASEDRILDAGPLAGYLYLASLAFAKRTRSDGKIKRGQLLAIAPGLPTPAKHAAALVRVGLWSIIDEGWTIPAWLKHNPSKAQLDAAADISSELGIRGNHIRHHVNEGKPNPRCELCVNERLVELSGTRTDGDRAPDRGGDRVSSLNETKGNEGKRNETKGREELSSSSSDSQPQTHPSTTTDDDDLAKLVLGLLATDWTKQNARPGKERGYRQAIFRNAEDHLPRLRELIAERPRAEPRTIATAYNAGGWARAISPDAPTPHPTTCVCDGTGIVPVDPDNDTRDGYVRPCTAEQNLATIHALRNPA